MGEALEVVEFLNDFLRPAGSSLRVHKYDKVYQCLVVISSIEVTALTVSCDDSRASRLPFRKTMPSSRRASSINVTTEGRSIKRSAKSASATGIRTGCFVGMGSV